MFTGGLFYKPVHRGGKKMKKLSVFLLLCGIFWHASSVNAYQWNVDRDHTEIGFKVKHILTDVSGQFSDFEGTVFFNPDTPDTAEFKFTVKVDSVDTNNGKRDTHLRSKDFFDADQFPVMTFESTKIFHIQDNRYALEGNMTIKDVTRKMNLEFSFFEPVEHPFDKKKVVAGFKTGFVIPRIDFHVGDGKFLNMGVVGKDVVVDISMEALREK